MKVGKTNILWNKRIDRLSLVLVLSLHVVATFIFLPPWEIMGRKPLLFCDHPVHTHRAHMYKQGFKQSWLPWGYDPDVSAGCVMNPGEDVGAKPQQVLGILLPFLNSGTIIRFFLFVSILTFPIWILLTCRHFNIPVEAQVWVMITLLVPAWLYGNLIGYFRWGLAGFAFAGYFSPYVLALFLKFLDKPGIRNYLIFFISSVFLFLLHILGPIVIILPLIIYTIISRQLSLQWRIALFLVPVGVLVINAFWFIPCLMSRGIPHTPWLPIQELIRPKDMTYENWTDLMKALTPFRLTVAACGLSLATHGFVTLRKFTNNRMVLAFAMAASFAIFLKIFGSFLPIFVEMQPARFLLPAFSFLTIPIGIALYSLIKKTRLPTDVLAVILSIFLVIAASILGRPESLPLPSSPDPLVDFVTRFTDKSDRLLIETRIQSEPKVLPLTLGREVIGNTYPYEMDPVQFRSKMLFGKNLDNWSHDELRLALDRWGVSWIFTNTEDARSLISRTILSPGKKVGSYYAFKTSSSPRRFLVGNGRVVAKVNRLELSRLDAEEGLIVLKYRYHPAWKTSSGLPVYQYPVPEDPSGFIALKDPPKAITLRFNPWAMFNSTWPHENSKMRIQQ